MDLSEEEYLFLIVVLLMTIPLKNLIPQIRYPPHITTEFGCRVFCLLCLIIASKKFITLSNNVSTELLAGYMIKIRGVYFVSYSPLAAVILK